MTLVLMTIEVTCLWKLRSLKALSSIMALVLISSGIVAGRSCNSLILHEILAAILEILERQCIFEQTIFSLHKAYPTYTADLSLYLFSLSFSRSIGLSPCGLETGAILLCFCCIMDCVDGGWAAPWGPVWVWAPGCCPGGLWGSWLAPVFGGTCVIWPPEYPELKDWLCETWELGTCPGCCPILPLESVKVTNKIQYMYNWYLLCILKTLKILGNKSTSHNMIQNI